MPTILGISAFYHDSAAAVVRNGRILAAAQEERFSRKKHDDSFPKRAIEDCLARADLEVEEIDYVGFYDKPLLKFDRLLSTYLAVSPFGLKSFQRSMPQWLKRKLHLPREMRRALGSSFQRRFIFTEHHESHAASAFFPSPFEEAAILTLDGVGEWATASLGVGRGKKIDLSHELRFPHSLGLLYSAFTYYCGFKVNSGEYKLMGLAPYGEPRFEKEILEHLIDLKEDGSFRLDMSYFDYCQGLTMTSPKFHRLFGFPPRRDNEAVEERHKDLAASIQRVTEEIMLRCVRHLHSRTGLSNLCLAGGVALNCVGNGRILREGPFENLWIQPAAGDAGGALGVALYITHQLLGVDRDPQPTDTQQGSLLGASFSENDLRDFLNAHNIVHEQFEEESPLLEAVTTALDEGQVIGWFQGAMEFGPRALGSRSILGDARHPEMQSRINQKVKFREGFRPFAPIVLKEHAHEYFEMDVDQESPYMLLVAPVQEEKRLAAVESGSRSFETPRSLIPAVTHVDYSARVQTVDAGRHGRLRRLMEVFYQQTGSPVLVNTSFNLGWEPIVGTPLDAWNTFMGSELDLLCLGTNLVRKRDQPAVSHPLNTGKMTSGVLHELLISPCCETRLDHDRNSLVCTGCLRRFDVTDGIPQLFWPHDGIDEPGDVTDRVKAFYEETPFPNYDEHDSVRSLIERSREGRYASRLNASIPFNSRVLEVGCGTGQLSNYLGLSCRQVVGADLCLNSLRLGEAFRRRFGLNRVGFLQMNLFRPVLAPASFDVLLCNGVLHHTADPQGGFDLLVHLVKPGGFVVIGLYNRWGRLFTGVRRMLFRLTAGRARGLDPVLRRSKAGKDQRTAWFEDQYRHPHESKHTLDEVIRWFEVAGVEPIRGIPAFISEQDGLGGSSLFGAQELGSWLDRLLSQLRSVLTGQKEGGFFVVVGRKSMGDDQS